MLYSKNGSIPKPETDGTEGWVEVEDPPIPPEGKEVVWWCPPGWVVRDPQPADEEGFKWTWSQTEEQWVKCALSSEPSEDTLNVPSENVTPEPISGNLSISP